MENDVNEALRSTIRVLVIQEVRLLRTEEAYPSPFVIGEMKRSIQETKGQVTMLLRTMDQRERNRLLKEIINEALEEEMDLAIQARKDRCLRCIHLKYFDQTGKGHRQLPLGPDLAETIGCEEVCEPGMTCQEYVEKRSAVRLDAYVSEMNFFCEVLEMFDRLERIWEDYLTR